MKLAEALTGIAKQLDTDPGELIAYADEINLGGYHPDEKLRKWNTGSIFEVEGKILYAITRVLQPTLAVNLGTYMGCSVSYIAEALKKNGRGKVIAVDIDKNAGDQVQGHLVDYIEFVTADAVAYMQNEIPSRRLKLVFEDLLHSVENTQGVWGAAFDKLVKGGVVVSHDALHYVVGSDVRKGIDNTGHDYETYLVEPSDCGLAIGVNNG